MKRNQVVLIHGLKLRVHSNPKGYQLAEWCMKILQSSATLHK